MKVKVITLPYEEGLDGFSNELVEKSLSGRSVLELRDHFFVHGGRPHLALICMVDDGGVASLSSRREGPREDPGKTLPEELRPLYRDLRTWRNERAKKEGIPSYLIFRNVQLAEICSKRPRSLAALREIDGIGEATCSKYGADVLGLIPADLQAEVAREEDAP